jgi:hypothetical protein
MAKDLFHNEVRSALEKDGRQITHDRILYLAVPFETYEAFFRFEPVKTAIARFQVKLLVYNTEKEEIEQWIE